MDTVIIISIALNLGLGLGLLLLHLDSNSKVYTNGKVTGKKFLSTKNRIYNEVNYYLSIEYTNKYNTPEYGESEITLNKDVKVTEEVYNSTNINDSFKILVTK